MIHDICTPHPQCFVSVLRPVAVEHFTSDDSAFSPALRCLAVRAPHRRINGMAHGLAIFGMN